jgi:hypothetical protein
MLLIFQKGWSFPHIKPIQNKFPADGGFYHVPLRVSIILVTELAFYFLTLGKAQLFCSWMPGDVFREQQFAKK